MEKWKIGWGVSNLCNMRCGFCYSRKARQEADFHDNIREGMRLIRENKDRIESINFGTGEPTLVPELFRLCEEIRDEAPHISIGITTNGTLAQAVEDPYRREVFNRCIDDVDVSLDYGTDAEQDRSRNYPGAFRLAEQSLALCQEYGKNASIVNALHRYNCSIQNMDALMRLARVYGSSLRINIYRPTFDFDYVLDYERLKEILIHIVKTYEIESLADPLFASLFKVPCPSGDPVARSSFRILPNGFISPSTYLLDQEWRAVRIDEVHHLDDLHRLAAFRSILDAPVPDACRVCPLKDVCRGGVIDRRWLWYHDLEKRDPYCPLLHDDVTDWTTLSGKAVISAVRKSFVHDGYLPTLIFGPDINLREKNRWDQIYLCQEGDFYSDEPEPIAVQMAQALLPEAPDPADKRPDGKLPDTPPDPSDKTPGGRLWKDIRVVDLGSGHGRNGMYFLRKSCFVTFVDSSRIVNDRLFGRIQSLLPDAGGYQILDMDVAKALRSMEDARVDGILAVHVISHGTPDEIELDYVRQMYRVLKEGGLAAVTLPSTEDRRCSRQTPAEIISFSFPDGPEKGIVHSFYSEDAVRSLFRSFEILTLKKVVCSDGQVHWHLLLKKPGPAHTV